MNKIFIKYPSKATTLMMFARVGSRYEDKKVKGISHVLEHLMFKGTKTRTALQIAKEIEKYGAYFNAQTGYELTNYIIKTANNYKIKSLEILLDMLKNSIFDQKELDKELKVVLEELKMYDDNPSSRAWDLFMEAITKKEDGLHTTVIGTRETLANIDRKELIKFYSTYYNNLTLVKVGDVQYGCIDKDLELLDDTPLINGILLNDIKGKVITEEHRDDLSQTNMIMGNAITYQNQSTYHYFMFELLNSILNNMSGRLFQEVREKHNLVYRVSFNPTLFRGGSAFWTVALGLDRKNVDKAYGIVLEQLNTLKNISDKELKYAITKYIGATTLHLDDTMHIGYTIVECEALGIDFKKVIFAYDKYIEEAAKEFRNFIKSINFNNNLVALVSPKE